MAGKKKQQDKSQQSSQDQRVAKQLAAAQESIDAALNDISIDRHKLANKLTALATQFEARTKLEIYQEAAKSLRAMISQLDLESYQAPIKGHPLTKQAILVQAAVKKALSNSDILRTILAMDIEEMARTLEQDDSSESQNSIIATQIRGLIPQLNLENYTASDAEESLLTFLGSAPVQVQTVLDNPELDRYPLVKQLVYTAKILDQDIGNGPAYPMLLEQIYTWLESLGMELADRAEDECYAEEILAEAEALTKQALSGSPSKRKALAKELEANVHHFEEDEPEGSTYQILAQQLRALIKQLEA